MVSKKDVMMEVAARQAAEHLAGCDSCRARAIVTESRAFGWRDACTGVIAGGVMWLIWFVFGEAGDWWLPRMWTVAVAVGVPVLWVQRAKQATLARFTSASLDLAARINRGEA